MKNDLQIPAIIRRNKKYDPPAPSSGNNTGIGLLLLFVACLALAAGFAQKLP